ncbi:MAG: hypothetical protein SFU86_06080 [Pirellulaceae bacterium]|nr:hypothetical protein [Pirellulaceae bacterium]
MSRRLLLASAAMLWLWNGPNLLADDPSPAAPAEGDAKTEPKPPGYIRVRRNDKGEPVAMETAVVRYVSADGLRPGVTVDLIGAVHVGDRAYYDALNKLFTEYEVVLYELVAPEGTRIPKEGRKEGGGSHPVAAVQNGMSTMLELKHQLDCIDYTKENLVHADMSPDEFNKAMSSRGESFLQMFLRLMGQGMAQQAAAEKKGTASGGDFGMLLALFSKDRARQMKIMMAEQFEGLEGQMALFDGPEGSTIITERNKRAFEVLEKQLAAGKKDIGVFYGAGHFPDMDKRLAAEFGLKRNGDTWIVAWSLVPKSGTTPAPSKEAEDAKSERP